VSSNGDHRKSVPTIVPTRSDLTRFLGCSYLAKEESRASMASVIWLLILNPPQTLRRPLCVVFYLGLPHNFPIIPDLALALTGIAQCTVQVFNPGKITRETMRPDGSEATPDVSSCHLTCFQDCSPHWASNSFRKLMVAYLFERFGSHSLSGLTK
jgi:hypothetical protein